MTFVLSVSNIFSRRQKNLIPGIPFYKHKREIRICAEMRGSDDDASSARFFYCHFRRGNHVSGHVPGIFFSVKWPVENAKKCSQIR